MTAAAFVEIELDGARRRVALRRAGDGWIAGIDGREVEMSVVEVGGRWSMLVGPASAFAHSATADKKAGPYESYDVAFDQAAGGGLIVHVNGVAVPLTMIDQRQRGGKRTAAGDAGRGPRTIVAPMPGRIVKVLVKPEEAVSARQPLLVVEAMKMENELRAPRGGVVAEVRVAEGTSVEANTVLLVLR